MPHGGNYFNDDCEVRKSPFVELELCKFREKVQKLLKNIALFTSVTYTPFRTWFILIRSFYLGHSTLLVLLPGQFRFCGRNFYPLQITIFLELQNSEGVDLKFYAVPIIYIYLNLTWLNFEISKKAVCL